jgi:hypothetical protein
MMKRLVIVTLVTAVGCASHDGGNGGGDDGGDGSGSGSGSGTTPPKSIDVTGTYRLQSTFDIATNMPSAAGTIVNGVIAATDDADDPMHWVLDQMIATLPDGDFKTLLVGAEPFIAPALNAQLTQLAPDFVATFERVGHDLADVSKRFGLAEKLDVTTADQSLVGIVTADGFHFVIEGAPYDYSFAAYQLDNIVADAVPVYLDQLNRFSIGEHHLPVPYSKLLRIGLDAGIIPAIDPTAHDLGTLLTHLVDCTAVGAAIDDALGFGGAAFWAGACTAGLQTGAQAIYAQLVIDTSLLDFDLTGNARGVDANQDYVLDRLDDGTWSGTLTYATTSAPLGTATFTGKRE